VLWLAAVAVLQPLEQLVPRLVLLLQEVAAAELQLQMLPAVLEARVVQATPVEAGPHGQVLVLHTAQVAAAVAIPQTELLLPDAPAAMAVTALRQRYKQDRPFTMAVAVVAAKLKTMVVLVEMAAWAAAAQLRLMAQTIRAQPTRVAAVLVHRTHQEMQALAALVLLWCDTHWFALACLQLAARLPHTPLADSFTNPTHLPPAATSAWLSWAPLAAQLITLWLLAAAVVVAEAAVVVQAACSRAQQPSRHSPTRWSLVPAVLAAYKVCVLHQTAGTRQL
jgi:hypothetical protein